MFIPLTSLSAAEPAKPNIVFILADDLGYMDVGAYNPKTLYETPNIDGLAKRGMKFTQAYGVAYAACCVCSPTRASIMTGKYPPRYGITSLGQNQSITDTVERKHERLEESGESDNKPCNCSKKPSLTSQDISEGQRRGDKTAIELFLAGIRGWEAGLRRRMNDANH